MIESIEKKLSQAYVDAKPSVDLTREEFNFLMASEYGSSLVTLALLAEEVMAGNVGTYRDTVLITCKELASK